ncbi:MAG: hypothetical protein KME42_14215 [Tildeniella nuda ZEHNDER 1965/U140]|jgi:hypothetical protein|nr:hypothetical protein [Tildeniella nuda ZEHNDER 1965/U140]
MTAIFTEDDKDIYAPSVTLTDDALTGAISFLQALVEGTEGANRPLALTQFEEILEVNRNLQTVRLSYLPIAVSPVIALQYRSGNYLNHHYRPVGTSAWQSMTGNNYILDRSTGQINLNAEWLDSWGRRGASPATEVTAVYTAGYDFTTDSYDVQQIKALFGQLLTYQQSARFFGFESVDVDQEVAVKMAPTATVPVIAQIPKSLLLPFKKYRPRGT